MENKRVPTVAPDTAVAGKGAEKRGLSMPARCRDAEYGTEFVHPADMADHLENLSLEKQVCALRHMPTEDAAEALAELD